MQSRGGFSPHLMAVISSDAASCSFLVECGSFLIIERDSSVVMLVPLTPYG